MTGPMTRRITVEIDTNVGAAYIELSDEPIVETVEVTPSVQVDVDATGTVVGVELLSLDADLPVELLERAYQFPAPVDAQMLSAIQMSYIRPKLATNVFHASSGEAYVPALQPVLV
jgi:uncharacterized protein YuzE